MNYTWVRATHSQVIVTAPGYIGCIILTPADENDVAHVDIYDGESTGDPKILRIRCGAGITKVVRFQPPLETQRGLYVALSDKASDVVIQHSWGPE